MIRPAPRSTQFEVALGSSYYYARVDTDALGNFVVVWQDYADPDDQGNGIVCQLFSSDGTPTTPGFRVNSFTTGSQRLPDVARQADGDFVVVWHSYGSPLGQGDLDYGVRARRFFSTGADHDFEDFQVNSYTTDNQLYARVAYPEDGSLIIVWETDTPCCGRGVRMQRLLDDLTPLGTDFEVNTYTTSHQSDPSVAVMDNGDFLVTWTSNGSFESDLSGSSIQARRFTAEAQPRSASEWQVNTYTSQSQDSPDVAVTAQGDVAIVWQGSTPSHPISIAGWIRDNEFFRDGFESGDTSSWSNTVP